MGAFTRPQNDIQGDLDHVFELFPRLQRNGSAQRGGSLSGGEQQMLAIGRAMMARPRVLLLDEPSLGCLDFLSSRSSRSSGVNSGGTTILLVEQNALQALIVATGASVIQTGQVALSGASADLRENEMVRKAYLGDSAQDAFPCDAGQRA